MLKFEEAGLRPDILEAIAAIGFQEPTPIQEKTIPHLLSSDRDLIGLAQTGTGKTAAFGLPLIQLTDVANKEVQSLILCPTRELCMQIANDLENYSKHSKGIKVLPVYGGANILNQIRELKKNPQIVVGTPGRVLDLIKRSKLHLESIRRVVLDEADEMLNMGFKEDLDAILSNTPKEKQALLFSATMPKEVQAIAKNFMSNAVEISVGNKNSGTQQVEHQYYIVRQSDKFAAVRRLLDINPGVYGIVFCRTRHETKELADNLMQAGYKADALHGDLSQAQRDHVMTRFRMHHIQLLIATDVAARGLDVNDLTHVINYSLPDDLDAYIHRSGRTGRAGKKGISLAIIQPRDARRIKDLERRAKISFTQMSIPTGEEICEKQLFKLIDKVENTEVNEQIEKYLTAIYDKFSWMSREELIKRFVSVEFNQFLQDYKKADDLNARPEKDRKAKKQDRDMEFSRFHINLGKNNDISPGDLIHLINKNTRSFNIQIGRIDLMKKFSFFEVDAKFRKEVINGFRGVDIKGVPVVVEEAKPDTHSQKRAYVPKGPVPKKRKKRTRIS
ncbi:MAG: DEAD/DEAH box helicase [Bacteroidota bacterium]